MKKSSAKARRQRDDRAYAEFEAMMRRLANASRRDLDEGRVQASHTKPTSTPAS
jgi:hypothetical protein